MSSGGPAPLHGLAPRQEAVDLIDGIEQAVALKDIVAKSIKVWRRE
jgi:hypothetical protein